MYQQDSSTTDAGREQQRLAALARYCILEAPAPEPFNEVARLASWICDTPRAFVTFLDRDHVWVKASANVPGIASLPREIAFCNHVLSADDLLEIPDTHLDERFRNHPMVVHAPHFRSYAGAALRTPDGQTIGTLCALDYRPRTLTDRQRAGLRALARQIITELELQRMRAEQTQNDSASPQTEDLAQTHRRQLADFIDNGTIGMQWCDAHGRILWANRAQLVLLGYRPDEYIGRSVADFHADQAALNDIMNRLLRGRAVTDAPARMKARDGTIREVLVNSSGRWRNGQFMHSRCFIRDVTEQNRTLDRLRLYREILAHSTDAIALIDTDGRYIEQNAAHAMMTGFSDADLVGKTPADHLGEETFAAIAGELEAKGFWRGETVSHTAYGTKVPIELSAFTVRHDDGTPICYVGIKRDITERRRSEQALHEHQQQLQSLFTNALDGIIVANDEGRCVEVNPAACAITGFSKEELLARSVWDLTEPVQADPAREMWRQFIAVGRQSGEFPLICKDGRKAFVDYRAVANVRPGRHLSILRDVTDRRQAEEDLRRAKEQAEHANQAKDQFLATLSHELRTPLTPVLTSVQMLESQPDLPPDMRETLRMIRRNVELETRLIDDLLDLTRITRGKLELQRSPVDLHVKLRHVLGICEADIRAKAIRLRLELGATSHITDADAPRLQQVLWNLIKNSVKFTPEGGQITIRTRNGPSRIVTEISDTGIGIDPVTLPRLFNAFEQGGRDMTRRFGGLGLGLSISKALIDAHGGTLSVASDGLGRGATFSVTLPLHAAPSEPARVTAPASPVARLSACRVLLVEDHADTARVMARLLRASGYSVKTADSVATALQVASAEPFDVLVSDIGLPDGSGLDLMRQLKSRGPVKGIALSGFGMEEDIEKSHAAGFRQHLTKPVDLHRLKTAIDAMRG